VFAGVGDGSDQVRPFGVQPRRRPVAVVEPDRVDRAARVGRQPEDLRVQLLPGGIDALQVVVVQPADGRPPVGRTVLRVGPPGGVDAQEVVQHVPARGWRVDQVRPDELGQQPPRGIGFGIGQGGRGHRGDVRSGDQPEQPKQPPGVRRQGVVRQVERHSHGGLGVAVHLQRGPTGHAAAVPGSR